MKDSIAVIPARGGSKRIPRKNIKPFAGQPMIAWSIRAALDSGCFERVIVSTDDQEIADVALACGAEAPFLRPAELADDYTATIPVIKHAILELEKQGIDANHVCCIYATAPFIRAEDIQKGRTELISQGCDYVFSANQFPAPVERSFKRNAAGYTEMLFPEHFTTRSQDLSPTYYDAAQFYWGKKTAWLSDIPVFSESARFITLPSERVQDIDTTEDWALAELKFKLLNAGS